MAREKSDGKASAAGLLAVIVIASACSNGSEPDRNDVPSSSTVQAEQSDTSGQADFRDLLAEVGRRQQVDVVWTGGPYRYDYEWGGGSAEDPAEGEVARVAAAIARELRLYPAGSRNERAKISIWGARSPRSRRGLQPSTRPSTTISGIGSTPIPTTRLAMAGGNSRARLRQRSTELRRIHRRGNGIWQRRKRRLPDRLNAKNCWQR